MGVRHIIDQIKKKNRSTRIFQSLFKPFSCLLNPLVGGKSFSDDHIDKSIILLHFIIPTSDLKSMEKKYIFILLFETSF